MTKKQVNNLDVLYETVFVTCVDVTHYIHIRMHW